MEKQYKIKRAGRDRRKQKTGRLIRNAFFVLLLGIVFLLGWKFYPTIRNWVDYKTFENAVEKQEKIAQREEEKAKKAEEKAQKKEQKEEQKTAELNEGEADVLTETEIKSDFPLKTALLGASDCQNLTQLKEKLEVMKAAGTDGVLLDLKDSMGQVCYTSNLELVQNNPRQTAVKYNLSEVISVIKNAGLTPIGRLCCFDDRAAAGIISSAMVKYDYTDTNWINNSIDAGGHGWLNPNSSEAQNYLLAILQETMDMGMETVILDNVQFPTGYSLNYATYGAVGETINRSGVLASFVERANKVAEGKDGICYIKLMAKDASGADTTRYGDTPNLLMNAAKGIVIDVSPEQFGGTIQSSVLNIKDAVKNPGITVQSILNAMPTLTQENLSRPVVGWVQGYTSVAVSAEANKTYTQEDIDAQVSVLQNGNIHNVIIQEKP